MLVLRFIGGRGLASQLIQLATWSWVSHVDFELPDGRVLGAVPGKGVCIRDIEIDDHRVERYGVKVPFGLYGHPLDWAAGQIGKPYDWAGILGYGLRRNWQEKDAWFCSELVAWAFQGAGHPILRAKDVWRITPRDLLLSPYLIPLSASTGGGRAASTAQTARGHLA